MKAIVQNGYGEPAEVLRLGEIDKPRIGQGEVLVRVRAASVHPDVWHVVTGRPYALRLMGSGLIRPKAPVPGTDVAGIVEAAGSNAARFAPGDAVFGECNLEMQWKNGGAFAEYVSVPEDALAAIPRGITFAQAAAIPTSGIIAWNNLMHQGALRAGQNVLINGAGGGVGSMAVQIAKAMDARVTGVDEARKAEMVLSLGADRFIDYAKEDFTHLGDRYDLILDVASTLRLADCKRVLAPAGIYVLIGHDHFGKAGGRVFGSLPRFLGLLLRSLFDKQLPRPSFSMPAKKESMALLQGLLEAGKLTPVIDRTFPLEDAAEAMRYMQAGLALGRIILAP